MCNSLYIYKCVLKSALKMEMLHICNFLYTEDFGRGKNPTVVKLKQNNCQPSTPQGLFWLKTWLKASE